MEYSLVSMRQAAYT